MELFETILKQAGVRKTEQRRVLAQFKEINAQMRFPGSRAWIIKKPVDAKILAELQALLSRYEQDYQVLKEKIESVPDDSIFQQYLVMTGRKMEILSKVLDNETVNVEDFKFDFRYWATAEDYRRPENSHQKPIFLRNSIEVDNFKPAWRLIQLYALNGVEKTDKWIKAKKEIASGQK